MRRRGWGEGVGVIPPCWFSLNNSEAVKPVTLAFWSILTSVPNLISLTHPRPQDIGQNSDRGISDFRISGQSLIKETYHNSRTSEYIVMKLAPVTNLDKRNKATSKRLTITSFLQIVTSLSFFQFMANLEPSPDFGRRFCKTYIFIKSNLFSYKN